MKQRDKVIIVILGIWTFIHCYLMIKAAGGRVVLDISDEFIISKAARVRDFYPFTSELIAKYDYTELFVYVVGAWGLFFAYKFLTNK